MNRETKPHHALKLSVTSIKSAPTSKDYRKMDDDSVDGIKPDTYKLPKTPTLFLLYYSKTTRHAEAHSLVKKARFAAEHAGIGIYKFDCDQGPRADCDSYVLDEKLSSTAKAASSISYSPSWRYPRANAARPIWSAMVCAGRTHGSLALEQSKRLRSDTETYGRAEPRPLDFTTRTTSQKFRII